MADNAASALRIADQNGMIARDDPDHPGEIFVRCKKCGWGDQAPVVVSNYIKEPFGCDRCENGSLNDRRFSP